MIGIKDQCFGVEIELTGITRAEAAEALAAYFETTPQRSYDNYDSWYVPDREGKQWRIMSDGSIRAEWNDDGHYRRTTDPEYRVEMVTPKLTYDEMEKFQECVRRIRQAGGKVNDSCGMHVHVDASNHNRQSLKNLLSIMYSKEDLLFKALKTDPARVNRWCQRVREPMLQRARRLSNEPTTDLTQLENIWYEGCISAHEHYNWTRYYALNLHSVFYRGTIEWRCFNSTLHAGRAKAYVNLCLAMSAQAIAQRTSVMRKTVSDNELFTFRVWLVRMGLNGDEFKNTRDHLLANLEGDRAWRYDKDCYASSHKTEHLSRNRRGDRMRICIEESTYEGTPIEILAQLRALHFDAGTFDGTEGYIRYMQNTIRRMTEIPCGLPAGSTGERAAALIRVLSEIGALELLEE